MAPAAKKSQVEPSKSSNIQKNRPLRQHGPWPVPFGSSASPGQSISGAAMSWPAMPTKEKLHGDLMEIEWTLLEFQ